MSDNPIQPNPPQIRLRRTGSHRPGRAPAPKPRLKNTRSGKGKRVYGGVILLLVLLGFVLQFHWMDQAKESGSTEFLPEGAAMKLRNFLLRQKGIEPEIKGPQITEEIPCTRCMGSGTILNGDGAQEICPICLGVGFHVIRRMDPADQLCPACAGLGRVEMPDTHEVITCPRCGGRGLIRSGNIPEPSGEEE